MIKHLTQLFGLLGEEKLGKWSNNGKWILKKSVNLKENTLVICQQCAKFTNVFFYYTVF